MPTLISDTDVFTLVEPTTTGIAYTSPIIEALLAESSQIGETGTETGTLTESGSVISGFPTRTDTDAFSLSEYDQQLKVTDTPVSEGTLTESYAVGPLTRDAGTLAEKAAPLAFITATDLFTLNIETGSVSSIVGPSFVALGDTDRFALAETSAAIIALTGIALGTFTFVARLNGRLTLKP